MSRKLINQNLLRSQMMLAGVNIKTLADAQGWSTTTAYRKISGKVAFTAPEIRICSDLLSLDPEIACEIFFTSNLS